MTQLTALNAEKLRALYDLLGDDEAATFVVRFSDEIRERLAELVASSDAPEQIAGIAHKLVALAGAIGLEELSLASNQLSRAARNCAPREELRRQLVLTLEAARRAEAALLASPDRHRSQEPLG